MNIHPLLESIQVNNFFSHLSVYNIQLFNFIFWFWCYYYLRSFIRFMTLLMSDYTKNKSQVCSGQYIFCHFSIWYQILQVCSKKCFNKDLHIGWPDFLIVCINYSHIKIWKTYHYIYFFHFSLSQFLSCLEWRKKLHVNTLKCVLYLLFQYFSIWKFDA